MVFLTAGLGGGTGTGAAPVIADIARQQRALTVAVVTLPFAFEGIRRRRAAEGGLERLREQVDALIVISNDRLLQLADRQMSVLEAFRLADDVLRHGVQGISDLVTKTGLINLDFADVRAVMQNAGTALMAIGEGKGDNRAVVAARAAISSPLLDVSIEGAKGVLLNVSGGPDMTLAEVTEAAQTIEQVVDPNANIFFGAVVGPRQQEEVRVTVIATGLQTTPAAASPREPRSARAGVERSSDTRAAGRSTPEPAPRSRRPIFDDDRSWRSSSPSEWQREPTGPRPATDRVEQRRGRLGPARLPASTPKVARPCGGSRGQGPGVGGQDRLPLIGLACGAAA